MPISSATDSLITYPCDFPIKVMGPAQDGFQEAIVRVVRDFDPDFQTDSMEVRSSSGGRYLGLTLTVRVHSRAQLDNLYRALHGHEMVSVVL
jgi:putative lipoic acid-binding regulatory protein